ncbi:peptidoglycan-binding domain-containing protein [Variovorax sp. GB1P17]|uniref:peptidoglycan-binding domain-containing protein n=1 Tax=Variovorax sp. GB1P17 TaxID=3443740 RepID=UPI003F485D27
MAHTYITNLGGHAYNIDWAVGVTGTNAKADVMLVQSLFNILYFDHDGNPGESRSQRYFPPADAGPLAVDGYYGPLTQRFIDQFEDTLRAADGWTMRPDRRMDPFMGGSPSPIQHEAYALTLLVRFCHFGDIDTGRYSYRDLPINPSTSPTLRDALHRRKKVPDQYAYHAPKKPVFNP